MGDQEGAPSRSAPAPEGSKVCKLQAMPAVASQVRAEARVLGPKYKGHTAWAAPGPFGPSHLPPSSPGLAPGAPPPPPSPAPPTPRTSPQHPPLSLPAGARGARASRPGQSLGFVIQQLTMSIPLEEKQLEPSYFALPALGVFTQNSRPGKRIYSLIMEFQPLLAWGLWEEGKCVSP